MRNHRKNKKRQAYNALTTKTSSFKKKIAVAATWPHKSWPTSGRNLKRKERNKRRALFKFIARNNPISDAEFSVRFPRRRDEIFNEAAELR